MTPPVIAPEPKRRLTAAYGAALFLASAGALVVEIVAGRMLAPYVGMSLYTWTAVIAVVLAGLSAGHWIGGMLSTASFAAGHRRLAVALGLAALSTTASLVLLRLAAPALLAAGRDPVLGIVLLTAALFFLPSLFVGVVSPVLVRLAIDARPDHSGRTIGTMFALGAAGSILGTLAAGYLFISWIGTIGTILSVAALYALIAAAFAVAGWRSHAARGAAVLCFALAASAIHLAGSTIGAYTSSCTVESDYYCIRVIDFTPRAGRPSALMVLDHLGHGINVRDDPKVLLSPYIAFMDRLAAMRLSKPKLRSAFFVGGGAFTLPRAWRARYPGSRLVVAEIDPAVTRVARRRMWVSARDTAGVLHMDARIALARAVPDASMDVVVGDAFRDIAVPTHLVTAEFAALVRRKLRPRGFYMMNVVDGARQPLLAASLAKTLARVFASVELWMELKQLRAGGRVTFVAVAGARPTPGDGKIVLGPAGDGVWLRWPPADLRRKMGDPKVPVLSDDYAPVDRLILDVMRTQK